ncbi:ABC transporter permease [bacterium]|nr:ABC transporter permease [bacterium]
MSPLALSRLAVFALWDEKRRVGLAVVGVVIGVTSIVLLISIGVGARTYVRQQFSGIGANVLVILPGRVETTGAMPGVTTGTPHPITIDDVRALRRSCREIKEIAPIVLGSSHISNGERSRDCLVLGTTAEFEEVRRFHPAVGHFLPPDGQMSRGDRICALGHTVARELFPSETALGKKVKIGGSSYRVQAIMERKGRQQGFDVDDLAFIPEPAGRRLFNARGETRVLVELVAIEEEEKGAAAIRKLLKERHKGVEDFTVLTAGSVMDILQRIVAVLTGALAGIAGVSLVVGGIGIANVAIVATTARTEEVGIKKALGAHPAWILAQFLLESGLTGALGGAAGAALAALGVALAKLALGDALPLETPLWSVALAIAVCAAIGLLAGGLPAARAARLDPVAALRSGGGKK